MTKQQLQQELKEKVREGVKPSDLRKLKRSKSADDIPKAPALPTSVPLSKEQIAQLQEQAKFHAETAQNYLKSLQISQAKVSELEKRLENQVKFIADEVEKSFKNFPPSALLNEQLTSKQKEIEILRKKGEHSAKRIENLRKELEEKNKELKNLKAEQSSLLDTNLSLKHQSLKDWFQQYQQTQKLESELKENVDYASNELVEQDKQINSLQGQVKKLKQEKASLQKDLALTEKLAELRKTPLPDENYPFLKYALYSLAIALFTLWLVHSFK